MPLPEQIQRQLDDAEALQQQLSEQNTPPTDAPKEEAIPAPSEPVPTPTENEPVQTPTESEKTLTATDEYLKLQQSYRSLQGMWQSSEARLRQAQEQVGDLTTRLEQALARIEKVSEPTPPKTPAQKLVTDKDAEDFGTDLIDLARRVAKEQLGNGREDLAAQIEELKALMAASNDRIGAVAQTQAMTAQERFYSQLDNKLSMWEQVQQTPECQQWLTSRVPGSRATWNDALQTAAKDHDAERAYEVFDTFLKINPAMDARVQKQPEKSNKRDELQRQVAPSKSAAVAAPTGNNKIFTGDDFAAKMNEVVRLQKQRKYDEAAAIETELNAALAEGRVTP